MLITEYFHWQNWPTNKISPVCWCPVNTPYLSDAGAIQHIKLQVFASNENTLRYLWVGNTQSKNKQLDICKTQKK